MIRQFILSLAVLIVAGALAWRIIHIDVSTPKGGAAEQHAVEEKKPDADKDNDSESVKVKLTEVQRKNAQLGMAEANGAKVKKLLKLSGKIAINDQQMARVMARFPGIVKGVKKQLGEVVQKGEILATVESNESLRSYDILSETAGTVVQKDVTLGEFVRDDKVLLLIGDLSTVFADLNVYLKDAALVRQGLPVWVRSEENAELRESTITYISPFVADSTQTLLARVVLSNLTGDLHPGSFITAQVNVGEVDAPVVVKVSALQTLKEKDVVFVEDGDVFVAREVELGERDNDNVEIVSGVLPGEKYVAENSFILKAEARKNEAKDND